MDTSSSAVVLPCSTADFGKFISGLLGKPQTLSNTVPGPFEIKREDILDLNALLTQRVAQQNEAVLAQFTAKLIFMGGSSVLLNSIEDFSTYNEVRPVACVGLHVTWVFLVKFNDKSHPEKQQVDVSFLGGGSESPMIDRDFPLVMMLRGIATGFIAYRVSHTARTWGSDIDSLLGSHLRGLVDEIPQTRKWLAKHCGKISLLVFVLLLLSSIAGMFYSVTSFVVGQRRAVLALGELSPSDAMTSQQMRFLLDTVAAGTWERFLLTSVVFLLLSFVLAIAVSVWVSSTADNLPPSFLLLTKESEKRKRKIISRNQWKWLSFLGSLIASLALGIGGNICYAIWFEQLLKP